MAQLARSTPFALILPALLATALSALAPTPAQAGGMVPLAAAAISGSGVVATESRTVADFQALSLQASVDLKIRQGDRESIEVRAENNLLPLLETVVETGAKGRALVVRWKRGESIRTSKGVIVVVTVVKLESIAIEGAGDVLVEGLTTPILSLTIAGSGDAQLKGLRTDELTVRVAGSGDVVAAGAASRVRISIAGSGDVSTTALAADEVNVSIAGSGDAAVQANKHLTASVAGSGEIVYVGSPTIKKSVIGSGSVRQR